MLCNCKTSGGNKVNANFNPKLVSVPVPTLGSICNMTAFLHCYKNTMGLPKTGRFKDWGHKSQEETRSYEIKTWCYKGDTNAIKFSLDDQDLGLLALIIMEPHHNDLKLLLREHHNEVLVSHLYFLLFMHWSIKIKLEKVSLHTLSPGERSVSCRTIMSIRTLASFV